MVVGAVLVVLIERRVVPLSVPALSARSRGTAIRASVVPAREGVAQECAVTRPPCGAGIAALLTHVVVDLLISGHVLALVRMRALVAVGEHSSLRLEIALSKEVYAVRPSPEARL